MIVGAGNNRQFQELCIVRNGSIKGPVSLSNRISCQPQILNQPDWASDPQFFNNADRVQNRCKLIGQLQNM